MPGVDYSSGRLTGEDCKKLGIDFVYRYVSTEDNPKNLHPAEVADFREHNIGIGLYFETTANRALSGMPAGHADALSALSQARKLLGESEHEHIVFTVDTDVTGEKVDAYFRGLVNAIGIQRVGAYGGLDVCQYLLDHKLCSVSVQTSAWSEEEWADVDIRQDGFKTLAGVQCDILTPQTDNLGLWGMPISTKPRIPADPADWTKEVIAMLPTVKVGAKGQIVKNLQSLLNAHGATLTVDGILGPHTDEAVKQFQSAHKLAVDGIVGRNTWTALVEG